MANKFTVQDILQRMVTLLVFTSSEKQLLAWESPESINSVEHEEKTRASYCVAIARLHSFHWLRCALLCCLLI